MTAPINVPFLCSALLGPSGLSKMEERWSLVREQRVCMNKLLPAFCKQDESAQFNSFHIAVCPYAVDSHLRILETQGFLRRHI